MGNKKKCVLDRTKTEEFGKWLEKVMKEESLEFLKQKKIAKRLGAHLKNGKAEFGFWVPEILEKGIPKGRVYLELFTPIEDVDLEKQEDNIKFRRDLVNLKMVDEYLIGVIENVKPGIREELGTLYWIKYQDERGKWHYIRDELAYSLPFGVFGPAELYDMDKMKSQREDKEYFENLSEDKTRNGLLQQEPFTNILQIHPGTASKEGTIRGLTKIYSNIAKKVENGEELTPAEENYISYESIQLMPIEPIVEYEVGEGFWNIESEDDDILEVRIGNPDMTNWGYDIVISGSAAVNPTILGSRRPDELVDLISVLHNFPTKPIKVIFDIVYGHADNQGLKLLNKHFFAGPNMYGQDMNFRHPVVRAIMLEMQKRKGNFGADGIRVDGAQDFKYWDPIKEELFYDDEYLQEMSDIVQEVAGRKYYPWMIFEDGRPWPKEDWELSSSYRSVIEDQGDVFQWGPLTFAHNTPFLYTFWVNKWWRVREIFELGGNWITGCTNHDTVRRGTQVDPTERINTTLGDNLDEILNNGYDNPAEKMLTYGAFPGVPMDFINASMRTPWSFIRNTDDIYGVKVVAEEKYFLYWQVTEVKFNQGDNFVRLKDLGFTSLDGLKRFMEVLDRVVSITDYNLTDMVKIMNSVHPPLDGPEISIESLKKIAHAWMEDIHDYCNVSHNWEDQDSVQTEYNKKIREFRLKRPWLINNLGEDEFYNYRHPGKGSVVYYVLRESPDKKEQVLFVANMEGEDAKVIPTELDIPDLKKDNWKVKIVTPGLKVNSPNEEITLKNSQGVLLTRKNQN
ncbi:MAG: glucosylglycerol hydrolase [Fusobacteriota bacterium]